MTRTQRSATIADLPTLAESGVPGYELEQWWGIVVPAGTPRTVIDELNAELNRHPGDAGNHGFHGAGRRRARHHRTPEDFGRHIDAELQRWIDVVRRTGIKAE